MPLRKQSLLQCSRQWYIPQSVSGARLLFFVPELHFCTRPELSLRAAAIHFGGLASRGPCGLSVNSIFFCSPSSLNCWPPAARKPATGMLLCLLLAFALCGGSCGSGTLWVLYMEYFGSRPGHCVIGVYIIQASPTNPAYTTDLNLICYTRLVYCNTLARQKQHSNSTGEDTILRIGGHHSKRH